MIAAHDVLAHGVTSPHHVTLRHIRPDQIKTDIKTDVYQIRSDRPGQFTSYKVSSGHLNRTTGPIVRQPKLTEPSASRFT